MAWAIADGPAGLEGVHEWDAAAAVLNDRSSGMPYVRLAEITGLYGLPEADDNRDQKVGRPGEIPRPGYARGKTAVYSGLILAPTPQELRQYSGLLRAAFAERALEHPMLISPPAFAGGGPQWRYDARVLGCDIPERQDVGMGAQPTPWQRTLTLTLRLADGRFYVAGDPTTVGPFADGSTHVVTNPGSAPTDPTISGTITNLAQVTLENLSVSTSNGSARLRFVDFPAGSTALTVNFGARAATVTVSGTAQDAWPFLDCSYSKWNVERIPRMNAGANSLKATGLGSWSAVFFPASW
jgi:hypothetical protein